MVIVYESFFSSDDLMELLDIDDERLALAWYPYLSNVVLFEIKFLTCTTTKNLKINKNITREEAQKARNLLNHI